MKDVRPAVEAVLAGAAVMWLLRPTQCLWHPSDPPQGPFCTTIFGFPTSWWFAVLLGAVVTLLVGGTRVRARGRRGRGTKR